MHKTRLDLLEFYWFFEHAPVRYFFKFILLYSFPLRKVFILKYFIEKMFDFI